VAIIAPVNQISSAQECLGQRVKESNNEFQSLDNQSNGTLKSNGEASARQIGELSENARNERIKKLMRKSIQKRVIEPV